MDIYERINAGFKTNENDYEVVVNGIVRHPFCTAEDVMRALATYLMNQP